MRPHVIAWIGVGLSWVVWVLALVGLVLGTERLSHWPLWACILVGITVIIAMDYLGQWLIDGWD